MTSEVVEGAADQVVFGGADSHADTIHVAVISDNGGHLADAEFATTAAVARHFGVWPATISTLERGIRRDANLTHAYRDWLHAA
ncbi:hypothetical protein [Streptomyces sp. NPDC058382]|uniref:hypothetical protein n=1 Tax=unclassified Streptomyces TaxID=2593676 RepID=UPI0036307455